MKKLLSFIKIFLKGYDQYRKYGGIAHLSIAQLHHGGILSGRKVIVTGGSDGIGLAMAQKFLSEGASVLITGRNSDKLAQARQVSASDSLLTMQWDVSDFDHLQSRFQEAVVLLGGLDIFVNNAAFIPSGMPNPATTWDQTMATNLKAPFFLCQLVADYYVAHNGGSCSKIINISSLSSIQTGIGPYYVSKSGVNAITRGYAQRYAPHNIVINGIAPGFCASSINYQDVADNAYNARSANKRIITPTEIAELACFLASDAANGIVGQTIFCDGGATL